MDSMIAKLIASREKSISTLRKEVARLDELAAASRVPAAQAALESAALVKRQRLEKLAGELSGLRQAAGVQTEIPQAVDPTVRKK